MILKDWLIVSGVFVGSFVLLLLLRTFLLRLLNKWCDKNKSTLNTIVYSVIRIPSYIWAFCISLMIAANIATVPEKVKLPINRVLQVALFVSIVIAIDRLAVNLVRRLLKKTASPMSESGLIRGLIGTVVYVIGALIILSQLGIQIGPLLTAMGVGGLAAALAFKDTLENMFSGIHLLIDRTVEVGDLIKVENQEGIVQDIGWRTSKIDVPEGLLIIPNTKLAQNITIRKKKNAIAKSNKQSSLYQMVK
jgi:small-conductance mechanosensitive channel